jgi:hypothetical protein
MDQKNTNSIISWIGLVVGVIALLIAVGAYNRTGADVADLARSTFQEAGEEVSEEARRVGETAQRQAAIAQAQARLSAVRTDIEADAITQDTLDTLAQARRDLEGVEFRTNVNIETQFDTLESQVRAGTANALSTIESIIAALRNDVQSETR